MQPEAGTRSCERRVGSRAGVPLSFDPFEFELARFDYKSIIFLKSIDRIDSGIAILQCCQIGDEERFGQFSALPSQKKITARV